MIPDLLLRRKTHFVLWRPGDTDFPPQLFIGQVSLQNPNFDNFQTFPLTPNPDHPELWEIAAKDCQLKPGEVYDYWFKVRNTNPYPYAEGEQILYCTDPFATTVDRSPFKFPPKPPEEKGIQTNEPASLICYQEGQLIPCDPNGKTVHWQETHPNDHLVSNHRLVIYELPTRWTRTDIQSGLSVGTFQDVMALLDPQTIPPHFPKTTALGQGKAHLLQLGVNAIELLPPADSEDYWEWGYGTANFFAPDTHLGTPQEGNIPTALTDLAQLVAVCHQRGLRFFIDVVMAFAKGNPYRNINFLDFFVQWGGGDPEEQNREGFGGDLLKYNYWVSGYQPLTGKRDRFVPSREWMKMYIAHWMEQYHIDGVRLDSVNNIANYDFLEEFKNFAAAHWQDRGGKRDRFLVVGEELSVPLSLIHQNRLDGLWNETFKQIIRSVILGENAPGDSSFEWSIRKLIDCNYLGFTDGTQAVNYLTSHDVGGFGNERFYNYLVNNNVTNIAARIKLAFVCLLTAVGIPMILAGDEFADEHDLNINDEHSHHKQVDPVNYERVNEPWRKDIFEYVSNLVKFRTHSEALAVNDTWFLHADYTEEKKVFVWQRGTGENLLIVVANFSDYGTPNPLEEDAEYIVPNWTNTPQGKQWREITQNRIVPPEWVGREPIFPWEAKVYAMEDKV